MMLKISDREELREISKGEKVMEYLEKIIDNLSEEEYLSLLYDRGEYMREMYTSVEKEKGKEKGSKDTKIEIARNMITNNEKIENIIKYTGLTKEEIEKIKI